MEVFAGCLLLKFNSEQRPTCLSDAAFLSQNNNWKGNEQQYKKEEPENFSFKSYL